MINYKDFGKRIKEVRVAKGFTQADIAKKMKLTIRHISMIESGRANPSMKVFIEFINILGTTPDYILLESVSALKITLDAETEKIIKDLNTDEYKIMLEMMKANKEAIIKMSELSSKKKHDKKKK